MNDSRLFRFLGRSAGPGGRRQLWLLGAGAAVTLAAALIYSTVSGRGGSSSLDLPPPGVSEPTVSVFLHDTGEKASMKIEDYIAGVVAAEMEPTWPDAALASQALLARTFTVERLNSSGGTKDLHGTDACDDPEHFQAFDASRVNDKVRAAVAATRGIVVVHGGKPIKAYYHANSGGTTATLEEGGFPERNLPYVRMVKDAAGAEKEASWSAKFRVSEIARAVERADSAAEASLDLPLGESYSLFRESVSPEAESAVHAGDSAPASVAVATRGPSGRVTAFEVGGRKISGSALRLAIGSTKMRSTLVDALEVRDGIVTMGGRGYGHGVGLSQWGAKALAEQGRGPGEIIGYYFPGVRFQRRWD